MRILFLAPQPFFKERGTPIAVCVAVKVLCDRLPKSTVELLTYHEGEDIECPSLKHHRLKVPTLFRKFTSDLTPGISLGKIICDLLFLIDAIKLVRNAKKTGEPFSIIHAVEESVFIAWIINVLFRVPYIYDMDSQLSEQLTDKWSLLRPLRGTLAKVEKVAVRSAICVLPMCDSIAKFAKNAGARKVTVLRDFPIICEESHRLIFGDNPTHRSSETIEELRSSLQIEKHQKIVLYVGNLEYYQGVDLLLDSFLALDPAAFPSHLVVIGGNADQISAYKRRISSHSNSDRVHFLGSRSLRDLGHYLLQADILTSPRILGVNTPMKVYSYIGSGKAIIATDIESHTQVLSKSSACLVKPEVSSFHSGLERLIGDERYRNQIVDGVKRDQSLYSLQVFRETLIHCYNNLLLREHSLPPS